MKYQRYAMLLVLFSFISPALFAQGLNTSASKEDWEEINFEFNSAVLTDGFPSLLRLADLLKQNSGYKVKLEGHTDVIGSARYNQTLGDRRANTVRDFLIKYGANANQISTQSFGKTRPEVNSRSKDARFMNRRVFMTVTDEQGRVIGEGGISDTLKMLKDLLAAQQKCCDEILRRLDRLDQIADLLQKLAANEQASHDKLSNDIGNLRKEHEALDQYVKSLPKPLTAAETSQIVDTRTSEQIEKARMPRFSTASVNVGADGNGELTFSGKGRLFLPFKEQLAVQMQGEYLYWKDRQEGQADVGLVNRFHTRAQASLFASFKNVNFSGRSPGRSIFTDRPATDLPGLTGNGTLGQAAFNLDYIFSRGRFGVYGTKAFLNDAVINRLQMSHNIFNEYYLHVIDSAGVTTQVGLFGNTYLEGNIGYLKSQSAADRVGGTARFVFPLSDRFAFTLEGGMNETMLTRDNNGRVVAGFQFGNFMRPKDYLEGYNGVRHAVPVDVARIRYEVVNRVVRTGNDAPVANAGPDQIGIAAGQVTLNGTASFDPEGDAITYQWIQVAGPGVSLSGQNTATATFTATEGQSYGFRLVVKDPQGLQGVATTAVTTQAGAQVQAVQIVRFQAVPTNIRSGETSMLDWQVTGADSVTISGIGDVPANGQRSVSPTQTTTYRLTARNARGEVSAIAQVVVSASAAAVFTSCSISPTTITAGEAARITYATTNADTVTISPAVSGSGSLSPSGTVVVSPTSNTSYTLTANGTGGPATCNVSLTVNPATPTGQPPRIVSFTGNPTTITAGQSSTLTWNVEGADTVDISGIGTVPATGSRAVSPAQTQTYVLTAKNANGTSQANAPITVNPSTTPPPTSAAPVIGGCQATPTGSITAGTPITISYFSQNATAVTFSPAVAGAGLNGPVTVTPTATTTYTLTAAGSNNRTVTCTVTVNITPAPEPPTAIIAGPSLITTIQRQTTLDATASTNPSGGALTYNWTALGTGATVLDQGQPVTRVQFSGQFGDYPFQLTVRNAQGQSATTTVTVRFISTTIP